MDGSFNAHWKKMDQNQKNSLLNRYDSMPKPEGVKERRIILRGLLERYGYKRPSDVLSTRPVPEQSSQAPTETRKVNPIIPEKPPKEIPASKPPKETSAKPVSPRVDITGDDDSRPQRVIYEVTNIRIDKPTKDVLLQVKYGFDDGAQEWIKASDVLDPDALVALNKALIKMP